MSGKAHRIDGGLYQYWLTVTPTDPATELSTLSTSAYVLLPDYRLAGEAPLPQPLADLPVATLSVPHGGDDALLGPLRLLKSLDGRTCSHPGGASIRATSYGESQRTCSVLVADSRADAIVFVLAYQANYGMVRLGGPTCRERTTPHVITRGTPMRYPVPFTTIGSSEMRETREWQIAPGVDTYYAFAVSDSRAAREFANHIDALPQRCNGSIRRGLESNALHRWLEEFAALAERQAPRVGWRAIEVKDVL